MKTQVITMIPFPTVESEIFHRLTPNKVLYFPENSTFVKMHIVLCLNIKSNN